MPSVPKPPKAEKSTRRGGTSRGHNPHWKSVERESARWLQDTYGEDTDPIFSHLKTSTGRVGHLPALGFDMTSEYAHGEAKDHELPKWFVDLWTQANQQDEAVETTGDLPEWIHKAWVQLFQTTLTRTRRRFPVLILSYGSKHPNPVYTFGDRSYKLPPMHIISPEHHREMAQAWLALKAVRGVLLDGDEDKLVRLTAIVEDVPE